MRSVILEGRKYFFIMLMGWMSALGLAGCGNVNENPAAGYGSEERRSLWEMEETGQPLILKRKGESSQKSEFGSVPYFRDDSGSNTQLVDGWLYGYWSRQLCRVNINTLETEVLYEAKSRQNGVFSIYDGYVYFLEQRNISCVDGAAANLMRVKCDGSEPEVLAENFSVPEGYMYCMNIYDGIIYLTGASYGTEEDYRFFRLEQNGGAEQISAEETLYGMLPEGYQDAHGRARSSLPNLVYCMSNFGYCFINDDSDELYRFRPETGEMEKVPMPEGNRFSCLTLTNDALLYVNDNNTWCTMDLDNLKKVTEIGELDDYGISFWDENGIYYVNRGYREGGFSIKRLGWDGEQKTLNYWVRSSRLGPSVYGDYLNVLYSDGTYLYYDTLAEGDGVIYRIPLEGDADEAEQVFVYYDNPVKDISTRETFSTTFTVEDTGDTGSFSITKVYLTEDTEAAEKINGFLEEKYSGEEEYIVSLLDEVRDMAFSDWKSTWSRSNTLVEESMSVSVDYIDDNYIGFCSSWYQYWNGAAHGMYGSMEYVFSRATGERLQITDVVKNSEAEICAIIAPYVEAQADWGTDEEGWEEIILEDGRFYLTTEGFGIHFDVYEMTCYAAGALDVIVPYEEFELRGPEETGLMHF